MKLISIHRSWKLLPKSYARRSKRVYWQKQHWKPCVEIFMSKIFPKWKYADIHKIKRYGKAINHIMLAAVVWKLVKLVSCLFLYSFLFLFCRRCSRIQFCHRSVFGLCACVCHCVALICDGSSQFLPFSGQKWSMPIFAPVISCHQCCSTKRCFKGKARVVALWCMKLCAFNSITRCNQL